MNFGISQNLVPNGDFEAYTSLPNSSGDWDFCTGWSNVNGNFGSWPYATPDYFHTLGSGGGQLPNAAFGTLNPQQGNAIMGLYSLHSSQLNSRDYIATQLSSPLVVGTTYTISFWLSSANSNRYYGSSSSHFGVQLTMAAMSQVQHENIGGIPQAEIVTNPWHPNWVFYSFTYVATSAFQYVTVGNFYNDAATTSTLFDNTANYPSGSYYFIDDLKIEASVVLPIELLSFDVKNEKNHVRTYWATVSEIDNDFFTLERSIDAQNWNEIGEVDGNGNSTELIDYLFIDRSPLDGLAYYRLKQTDFSGETSYSNVRSVIRDDYDIVLYPNPTSGIVTIRAFETQIEDISLFDALGKNVTPQISFESLSKNNEIILDISTLSNGVYTLRIGNKLTKIIKL